MSQQHVSSIMDDFGTSRTVHTVRHPEIFKKLKQLNVDDFYLSLNERSHIKKRINQVAVDLINWLKPVCDLSELKHYYHVNGTHNSIEQWMAGETRPICCLRGEYPYPSHLRKITIVDNVKDIPIDSVVYMSNPFSSNGNYDNRYSEITNPLVLDIAYVGTTKLVPFKITENTEQVFWSASKPFGLGNFRTGYRFSRKPDPLQDGLKDTGYFNLLGVELLSLAIGMFKVDELHELYNDRYTNICIRNNLIPSDSFLLASSLDTKYKHLMREDTNIRIPVGKILEKELL